MRSPGTPAHPLRADFSNLTGGGSEQKSALALLR